MQRVVRLSADRGSCRFGFVLREIDFGWGILLYSIIGCAKFKIERLLYCRQTCGGRSSRSTATSRIGSLRWPLFLLKILPQLRRAHCAGCSLDAWRNLRMSLAERTQKENGMTICCGPIAEVFVRRQIDWGKLHILPPLTSSRAQAWSLRRGPRAPPGRESNS